MYGTIQYVAKKDITAVQSLLLGNCDIRHITSNRMHVHRKVTRCTTAVWITGLRKALEGSRGTDYKVLVQHCNEYSQAVDETFGDRGTELREATMRYTQGTNNTGEWIAELQSTTM